MTYTITSANAISEHFCEVLRSFNGKGEFWRIAIREHNQITSSLLRLPSFDAINELVGLEALLIVVLKSKSDLRKLVVFLGPSLGRGHVHRDWHPLNVVDMDYSGCVMFCPRESLVERRE